MSDKNFKVKNGIDAAGKLTITNTSGATSLIEVNGAGGGQFTITPYGGISTNAGFYSIGGPSYFGGYGGTTSVVVNVTGASGQTEDLQRWTTFGGTVLAKVDSTGSISATDLTLSGNLTVNGTTTNLNSTNLIIEDKNIIIADVTTPTDTTADGAGITIKGATDKTFNWVNSTKSFTSSEPLVIDTSSTSSTALVVKASPTYPAQLQEWKNASGTTLAQIGYNGSASFYNIVPFTNSGTYVSLGSGAIDFISRATTTPTVIVSGAASQTANLTEWQDSAGTALAVVSNVGTIRSSVFANLSSGLTYIATNFDTNGIGILTNGAAQKGLIIKGFASQTANLQEWQDNSGTVLGSFNAYGSLYVSNIVQSGTAQFGNTGYASASQVVLAVKGAASQTANLQEWQNSSGTALAFIESSGKLRSDELQGITNRIAIYQPIILPPSSTNIALIVKGQASQTANLQEWQNSAGTALAKISAYGDLIIPDSRVAIGASSVLANTMLFANTAYSNYAPIVVRGAASQTANLQEWQDSSGFVRSRINPAGTFLVNGGSYIEGSGRVFVNSSSAAYIPLTVRGTTSQTGNLQEWQNSSGSVLSYISAAGSIFAGSSGTRLSGVNGDLVAIAASATVVPIISKGFASQTADLQQWQNNSGTVLARINASGVIKSTILADLTDGYSLIRFNYDTNGIGITTGAAAQKGLIIRGAASQTANLQEWQDSSGTVLAWVNPTGQVRAAQFGSTVGGRSLLTPNGDTNGFLLNTVNVGNKGLVIKGVASQTANVLEVYKDDSTLALSVRNNLYGVYVDNLTVGSNVYSNYQIVGGTISGNLGNVLHQFNSWNASWATVGVRGFASQTANLQEWQDSAGTVLARVNQNGAIISSSVGIFGAQTAITDTELSVYSTVATQSGIVVKSAVAQSNFIQQWQNSAGTLICYVGSGGNFGSSVGFYNDSTATNIGDTGNLLQSNSASNVPVVVKGRASQTANLQEWQNNSGIALAKVDANGNFSAISKSFDIPHPTKENMRLRYASLEGPENGVYIRGTAEFNIIELPEYWTGLVHENSITVSLTAVGSAQNIYVEKIENNKIYIGGELTKAFFTVYGERKDTDKLTVEY